MFDIPEATGLTRVHNQAASLPHPASTGLSMTPGLGWELPLFKRTATFVRAGSLGEDPAMPGCACVLKAVLFPFVIRY